jgi:hypothetical protein
MELEVSNLPDPIQTMTNDPDPLLIGIYAVGILVAVVWNLYAYYKLFTLDHVKREMAIKRKLRAFGLLDPGDD